MPPTESRFRIRPEYYGVGIVCLVAAFLGWLLKPSPLPGDSLEELLFLYLGRGFVMLVGLPMVTSLVAVWMVYVIHTKEPFRHPLSVCPLRLFTSPLSFFWLAPFAYGGSLIGTTGAFLLGSRGATSVELPLALLNCVWSLVCMVVITHLYRRLLESRRPPDFTRND